MAHESPSLQIRSKLPSDDDVVIGTWLSSLGRQRPFSYVEPCYFSAAHRILIKSLLQHSSCIVACDPSDPDQVYGYVVHGPDRVLHWIYVKHPYRVAGVGSRLMSQAFGDFVRPIYYTLKTHAVQFHEKRWNLSFRPHSMCEQLGEP